MAVAHTDHTVKVMGHKGRKEMVSGCKETVSGCMAMAYKDHVISVEVIAAALFLVLVHECFLTECLVTVSMKPSLIQLSWLAFDIVHILACNLMEYLGHKFLRHNLDALSMDLVLVIAVALVQLAVAGVEMAERCTVAVDA